MEAINTFATFITSLALLALVALLIVAVMYALGKTMQWLVRRRLIKSARREFAIAGKPATPPAERRNRSASKRAA
jgi:hypothetical protein